MTHDELKKYFPHASQSTIRVNPNIGVVGGLQAQITQPDQRCQGEDCRVEKGTGGVGVRVVLLAFRKRLFDDDNHIASLKFLRDAIAKSLGLDDFDPRLRFEYHQVKTDGTEGVVVKIEMYVRD